MGFYGKSILEYTETILNEAYIGKTETLAEAEKQIGIIRNTIKKGTDYNRNPEVLKFNRLMEKQFGMDTYALYIEPNGTINAFTMPVALNFDVAFKVNLAKAVEADQTNGYRFKPGNNLCVICNIYWGLLMEAGLTDAEIMAVILHETGHNFADSLNKQIRLANQSMVDNWKVMLVMMACTVVLAPKAFIEWFTNRSKWKSKQARKTHQRTLMSKLLGVKARFQDYNDYKNEVYYRSLFDDATLRSFEKQKKDLDRQGYPEKIKKSAGRINEVIADKFAGIYGYGPDQASALLKMDNFKSKAELELDKTELGKAFNLNYTKAYGDIYKYDVHPATIQRINEEIKTLERELNNLDIDPKVMEGLKKELKELYRIKNEAMKAAKEMDECEKYRSELNKKINSEDPDAVDVEIEERINDAFDKLLEESKNNMKGQK